MVDDTLHHGKSSRLATRMCYTHSYDSMYRAGQKLPAHPQLCHIDDQRTYLDRNSLPASGAPRGKTKYMANKTGESAARTYIPTHAGLLSRRLGS